MAVAPPPVQQRCPACHWRGPVIAPRSDALSPLDVAAIRDECPRCGNAALESEAVHGAAAWIQSMFGRLKGGRP